MLLISNNRKVNITKALDIWQKIWKRAIAPLFKWGLFVFSLLIVIFVFSWITLRINMSRKIVPVPNIIALDVQEARFRLQQSHLKMKISKNRKFSSTIEKDKIVIQSPAPGTKSKANSSVKVMLSSGTRIFSVPNIMGLSMRRAQIMLNTNGFDIGRVSLVYSESNKDIVIAQEPSPGIEVMRNSRVNLLVSLGPRPEEFVMPDLEGENASQVLSFLRQNGLRIGNVRRRIYPGASPGIVIQQYPQAGYKVNRESIINLWISQG
jgi:beta-lactam-binding protein with PASTA domain